MLNVLGVHLTNVIGAQSEPMLVIIQCAFTSVHKVLTRVAHLEILGEPSAIVDIYFIVYTAGLLIS